MTDINIDPNGPLAYLLDKPAIQTPNNALGKDAFLKLLVAQMKYQNPMEPTDSTEFISQTAQFTLVEQMENMAKSNADMLAGQLSATAASLIGKDVQWTVAEGDESDSPGTGTVQGVRITADGPLLIVDGWEVPLQRVSAFGVPEAEPEVPPTTEGTEATGEADASADDAAEAAQMSEEEIIQMITEELAENPVIPTDPTAPAA